MDGTETVAPGVTVMRNLEARLTAVEASAERYVIEQSDGEIRYDVLRQGGRSFAVRVRGATLEVATGVVSVRIEGERVFVTVASGSVVVEAEGRRDMLVGGDMLRLPRLRATTMASLPPPIPRAARPIRKRIPAGSPSEVIAVDSTQLTVRRAVRL
ncbi:MAG: hypothetical protein AAF721_24640 [Myxococcota bacterium]